MKRGQVTLYVIIAIFIVAAAGFVVYTQREFFGIKVGVNPVIRPIDISVQSCLKQTVENGIYLIGMQGGYAKIPAYSFETNFSTVAYGYVQGRNIFPSKDAVAKQLSDYINTMLPECVDFGNWSDFTANPGKVISVVLIEDDAVLVSVNWPVSLTKLGATYSLNKFSLKVPVRLGFMHSSAALIINRTVSDPNHIDLSTFIDINDKYNITVDVVPFNNTLVYFLTDSNSFLFEKPYNFIIAVGF